MSIERLVPARVERVFAAWTDPALMSEWLSPTGNAEVEADVRPGGTFRVLMLGEDMRLEHTGEYIVVEPPNRLIFTWCSKYTGETPSMVTVLLTPEGTNTRLQLTHERLPDHVVTAHESGWSSMVERLPAVLST